MTTSMARGGQGEPVRVPNPSGGPQLPRGMRLLALALGGLVGLAVLAATVVLPGLGDTKPKPVTKVPVRWARPTVAVQDLPARLGVRLVHVAVTGDGGLLDLRFQVVDPGPAAAIHDPETPPALVDERSGLVDKQLLMGHSHSGPFKQAVTYYLLFENTAGWVHRGSSVTVLLGNTQVSHVRVQ